MRHVAHRWDFRRTASPPLRTRAGDGARRVLGFLAVAALFAWPCGCESKPEPPAGVLRDEAVRGPLKFVVTASPASARVGDAIHVELRVEAPGGYEVNLPTAEAFGDLAARETENPVPRFGEAGRIWRRAFVIEPLVSGDLEIPPLVARYARAPSDDESPGAVNELVTNTLIVSVASVLAEGEGPTQPRDITGVLMPPRPPIPWWYWVVLAWGAVALIGFIVGVAVLILHYVRRPPPPIPVEVWALRALAELEQAERGTEEGIRRYYYSLTEIVRIYIEHKFALAAPEMTTEEFLRELTRRPGALEFDGQRLRSFLEACDAVKYAALRPTREEIADALATARAFVQTTAARAGETRSMPTPTEAAA